MIRNKFIKKLREKYQRGGLRDPYLTFQGRTISTDTGTRVGAGAKLSAPLLEGINYGKDATGLRAETDFAGTDSGPISVSDRVRAYNASVGLRGYHNRYLDRGNTLSLNTNIGAGIGTGDEQGNSLINPYGDVNISLLKSGRSRRNMSVGPALSYGTESSPTPGLRLGVAGKADRFSGNVGYDVTNNAFRAGVGYNFQTGGVADLGTMIGQKGIGEGIRTGLTRAAAVTSGTGSTLLGGLSKAVAPLGIASTLYGMYKGGQEHSGGRYGYTKNPNYVEGANTPRHGGIDSGAQFIPKGGKKHTSFWDNANSNYRDNAKRSASSFNFGQKQTGGMYDEPRVRKYHEGGEGEDVEFHINNYDPNLGPEHYQEAHHAGGNTGGDEGSQYGPNSDNPTGPPMEWGASWNAGGSPGLGIKSPYGEFGMKAPTNWKEGLGMLAGPAAGLTGLTGMGIKHGEQAWNKVKSWFEDGGVRHQTGGMYDQPQMYEDGGEDDNTIPEKLKMRSIVNKKEKMYYQEGGMYNQMQQYQQGGMQLPGGEMQQIPGSDAVQFNGASHDQGGIMLDGQTEVEGGETMDQVNMAQKGGKRDYFFSSHLKKGGRSYADMHKDILRNGGDQEEINMLAKMQEQAAGRNPKKVARLGGVVEYKHGGVHRYENGGEAQNKYNAHEANKPTFDLNPPSSIRDLKKSANKIEEMQYKAKVAEYEKQLAEYNKAKEAYETKLAKWESTEVELSDEVEQEDMLQELEEREAAEALDQKAIDAGYESNAQMIQAKEEEAVEKAQKKKVENDALVQRARDLGIELPKSIKPSELKKLITQAEVTFEKREGEEGVPKGQKILNVGGKEFYLDEGSRLHDIATTLDEDFGETWFNKADPELLEQIGVESFDDLLADGANDSKIIEAYQVAYNNKYPNTKIQVDGDLGEQTLLTGWQDEPEIEDNTIKKITTPEVNIVADRSPSLKLDALPASLIPNDLEDDIQLPGPRPEFTQRGPNEELLTLPMVQPSLLDVNLNDNIQLPRAIPSYTTPEDVSGIDPYKPYDAKVPWQAYAGMGAGLIPAAYAMFHKQPAAEQAGYTQGFTGPVIAQRGKSPRLERYDYNQDIANVGSEVRGMNKYIETSGGGPANMVNKMMAFNKGNDAKMKIRAAETRANIGVQNTEAQLKQQMTLDNMKRAQSASIFNAQMSRAETARMDQVDEANTARRQKRIDDMEYMKYSGMSQLGQSLQQGFGDILDYKADIAKAAAIGSASGNVYRDSVLYQQGWRYNPETGQLEDPNKKKFGGLKMLQKYKK